MANKAVKLSFFIGLFAIGLFENGTGMHRRNISRPGEDLLSFEEENNSISLPISLTSPTVILDSDNVTTTVKMNENLTTTETTPTTDATTEVDLITSNLTITTVASKNKTSLNESVIQNVSNNGSIVGAGLLNNSSVPTSDHDPIAHVGGRFFVKSAAGGGEPDLRASASVVRAKSATAVDDLVVPPIGTTPKPAGCGRDCTSTAPANNSATTVEQSSTTTQKAPLLVIGKWSYEEINDWGKVSPVCVQGWKQSPVHLSLEHAVTARNFVMDPLVFKNYDTKALPGNLTNNGHTLVWTIDYQNVSSSKILPSITGSGYGSVSFILDHLSFHWGAENVDSSCKGSDHVVDYYPSPLEVQFAHRNVKYSTYDEAQFQSDGLATISFLFRVVEDTVNTSTAYARIVNSLSEVAKPNTTIGLMLDLNEIIPAFTSSGRAVFYRYDGSQTEPPCFETVSWTVFQDRIPIPLTHVQAFRRSLQIKSPSWAVKPFQTMENNYRPIQMRNSRTIWTNGRGYASDSSEITNDFVATFAAFAMVILVQLIIL